MENLPDSIQKLLKSQSPEDVILGMELSKSYFPNSTEWIVIVWQPTYWRTTGMRTINNEFLHDLWAMSWYDK